MGYLVACHFTRQAPSGSSVRGALPQSIGFAIYRHQALRLFAIDTFRAAKPSRFPFSVATPAADLPLELPPDLAALSTLFEQLREEGIANGLKRSYINLACILSSCLGLDVLSVYADDDGNDFACVAAHGKAARIAARCGNQVVGFENGRVSRTVNESDDVILHQIVSRQFELFTGHPASAIGLGSFNAPENRGFVPVHE
jgi:hypothetical protein